jgi:hypothetical protein
MLVKSARNCRIAGIAGQKNGRFSVRAIDEHRQAGIIAAGPTGALLDPDLSCPDTTQAFGPDK